MARKIKSKIKISGKLQAKTPLHFGGNEINADTDLALAVNGRGEYYLAGTNLTGLLRAWTTRVIDGDNITLQDIDSLWGYQTEDRGHASFIIVEDGIIQLPSGSIAEIRDGVAIDRYLGTAAERQKYDREVIPKGSTIALNLTVERSDDKDDDHWEKKKYLLAELLEALQNQELRVGGGKTRGLGKVELIEIAIPEQANLLQPKGILDVLGGEAPNTESQLNHHSPNIITKSAQLKITINWKPLTPVMVKSEAEGIAVDILPLVSGNDDGNVSLVIPGASIKGVLRSQGEKIIRTVCDSHLPDDFLSQVQVELVKTLFGSAAKIDNGQQGYQGALTIDDCYADLSLTRQQWHSIQTALDSQRLRTALRDAGLESIQQAFHVAIDRWTGGAADGALFSVLEPMGIEWSPLELTLDLTRLTIGDRQYS